jgi:hypothetical protein
VSPQVVIRIFETVAEQFETLFLRPFVKDADDPNPVDPPRAATAVTLVRIAALG